MPSLTQLTELVARDIPNMDLVLSLGVVLTIFGIGGFVSAVHMREKNRERLTTKVRIAFAGLTENAFGALEQLREEINLILPLHDALFDPLTVIAEPSSAIKPAQKSIKLIKERQSISKNLKYLLVSCSIIKYSLLAFPIFCGTATMSYWLNYSDKMQWMTLIVMTAIVATLLVLVFLWFAFLDQRIQQGIEDGVVPETVEIRGTR
ncbi:hypothetical protein [Paeniglutamicibacter kerguelensis]|uniref:Di/tricarboxylate transporter n=1 Tax=Paeniglutamicibacter kerguelensis TaxID=254788 RepID=A0ABS4XHI4_9MICC|nr:hypothetical protein [Paeniglutamicibacter kerguelensis]MBP2387936.1 di/tricarboxylate transporter [Paeniglutamicibacter kerguelensis]